MKAYVLKSIGNLVYDEVNLPALPSDAWCIVKVRAAGICSSDIPRIFTKGTYHFPTIPGHEFAGEVHSVASDGHKGWIGKRVGVFPLIPCRKCEQCQNHHYEMCSNYDYLGSRRDGGFAEYAAVPVWNLIELPLSIPYPIAAMLEPVSVALHAIKFANIRPGMTVGIIGTGMIGISAGQWARKQGACSVTIIGRSEQKRAMIENCGLDYTIGGTNALEYDVVIEAVGTPESVDQAINIAKPGGTIVLMGNPSGEIPMPQNTYWRILRKQLVLHGTWNSFYDGASPSDWTEAIQAISNKEISLEPLITHTFHQAELAKGLGLMQSHREPYCKVMTLWNQ